MRLQKIAQLGCSCHHLGVLGNIFYSLLIVILRNRKIMIFY